MFYNTAKVDGDENTPLVRYKTGLDWTVLLKQKQSDLTSNPVEQHWPNELNTSLSQPRDSWTNASDYFTHIDVDNLL